MKVDWRIRACTSPNCVKGKKDRNVIRTVLQCSVCLQTRSRCPTIFPGAALRCVKRCGRNKRQVAGLIETTSFPGAPVGPTCCVMFDTAAVVWLDRDWLSVERPRDVPIMLSTQHKLKISAFNMF